jgi:2-polyprenyl-6-methoxyphenol hydroxylase-like FAD-dependent oxidoreductase
VLRIVDDTARLWRAPEVAFAAQEIGLDAFGHNIENRFLVTALAARARELAALVRFEAEADAVEIEDERVTVRCNGTVVSARLAIGAEGRRSLCRAAAGIDSRGRAYRQTALTFNLGHSRSTTTRRPSSTPRPGRSRWYRARRRSSLVFVLDPPRPLAFRRFPTPISRRRSSGARIRSWARSPWSPAVASSRWR